MSTFPVCGLSNIRVTENAIPLALNFCECPAALDALNSVEVPLTVQVKDDVVLAASMDPIVSGRCKFTGALITLAEDISRDFQLAAFANELFNVLNYQELMPFIQDACSGDVGINQYADTLTRSQYNALRKTRKLFNRCNAIKVFNSSAESFGREKSYFEFERLKEAIGVSDKFKIEWIKRYQDDYCYLYPKDLESCNVTSKNFCDLMTHEGLSRKDFSEKMSDRVCDYHMRAPRSHKYITRPLLDAQCIQKIHTQQFKIAVLGVVLAIAAVIIGPKY